MSYGRSLTKGSAALALGLAIAIDFIQIPATLAFLAGALASAGIDIPVGIGLDVITDTIAACIFSSILGFHWALLPTFVIELIPGLDMAPTWTGCVAYVCHVRKKQGLLEG